MDGDIIISRTNSGEPFSCPVCQNFRLNEDFDQSKQHLEEHGYSETPADPSVEAVFIPGRPLYDGVIFRQS